jgi:hypothetical protein
MREAARRISSAREERRRDRESLSKERLLKIGSESGVTLHESGVTLHESALVSANPFASSMYPLAGSAHYAQWHAAPGDE